MKFSRMVAIAAVASFMAAPALAQTTQGPADTEKNGHHYSGGPKTEVPHHMGKKDGGSEKKKGPSGSHHYSGGANTGVPHHMGAK